MNRKKQIRTAIIPLLALLALGALIGAANALEEWSGARPRQARTQVADAPLLEGALNLAAEREPQGADSVAPVLDLNGANDPGNGFGNVFTENAGAAAAADSDLLLSDVDDTFLRSAEVSLNNRPDGNGVESLNGSGNGTVSASYSAASGLLTFSGYDTLANYTQLLAAVTYNNSSENPNVSDRIIVFQVEDDDRNGDLTATWSLPVTTTMAVVAVNDAPTLANGGSMTLDPIAEDNTGSLGNQISAIVATGGADPIQDVDGDPEGIAVTSVDNNNGIWQYSLDSGATWQGFGPVSASAAVLLGSSTRIRFVPAAEYSGPASFSFRAWDQSSGSIGQKGVDTTNNGGSTPFSIATASATIQVLAVNDLPVLDLNGAASGGNYKTAFPANSQPVAIVNSAGLTVSDADNTMLLSATLTLTPRPDGAAEALQVNTAGTSLVSSYSTASGVLSLSGTDTLANYQTVLRTATYGNAAVNPTRQNRAVDFIVSDGIDFSQVVSAILAINSAPTLSAGVQFQLESIDEDETNAPGTSVAALLNSGGAGSVGDTDGDTLGVAVVGAGSSNGIFQYSLDQGLSWDPIGIVTDTVALLLDETARIRLVPQANFNGTAGTVEIRAWDQTMGFPGDQDGDTSLNGGTAAFSSNAGQVTIEVVAVNDAPMLAFGAGAAAVFDEDEGAVDLITAGLSVSDVDNALLAGAKITLTNRIDGAAESLAVAGSGLVTSLYDPASGLLTLSGQDTIAHYAQILAVVQYDNSSQAPDASDRIVAFSLTDGALFSAVVTRTVVIVPVNDAPLLDLNGAAPGTDYDARYFWGRGPAPIVDPNLILTDVDNTTIVSATISLEDPPDGEAESLSAIGSANIKVEYDLSSGVLELIGPDTVANFQQVLRGVSYNNVLPEPDTSIRLVDFEVFDGMESSDVVASHVRLLPPPIATIFLPAAMQSLWDLASGEPNDHCSEAFRIWTNRGYTFEAEDSNDWYWFWLTEPATVTVSLSDFVPPEGQVVVARGEGCAEGALELVGSNGNFEPEKLVELGRQPAGRYVVWIIADRPGESTQPYRLRVDVVGD